VGRRSPSDPDSYDLRLTRRAVRHGYKIEYANDTNRKREAEAKAEAEAAAGSVTQASGGSGGSGETSTKKDR